MYVMMMSILLHINVYFRLPTCTILTKDCYTINVVFVYNDPAQKVRRC